MFGCLRNSLDLLNYEYSSLKYSNWSRLEKTHTSGSNIIELLFFNI